MIDVSTFWWNYLKKVVDHVSESHCAA